MVKYLAILKKKPLEVLVKNFSLDFTFPHGGGNHLKGKGQTSLPISRKEGGGQETFSKINKCKSIY